MANRTERSAIDLVLDLQLPGSAAGELLAIVGRAQSGKTELAARLARKLLDRGVQIVVFDSAGAWAPADGRRLVSIPVAGGRHGDGPFEPTNAAAAVTALGDLPGVIIDLSLHPRAVRGKVVASAVGALLTREDDSTPLHIVIDEAGLLPRSLAELGPLGTHRRIGATLIAQRLQALDTAALNQASYLIAHCMTGPHDRRAFGDWLRDNNPRALADAGGLANLAVGEALAWRADDPYRLRRIRAPGRPRGPDAAPPQQGTEVRRWLDVCAGGATAPGPRAEVETILAAAERLQAALATGAITDAAAGGTTRPDGLDHPVAAAWPVHEYERDVLRAVVQAPGCNRRRAALLAGRNWRSQALGNALLALRTAGLVSEDAYGALQPGPVPDGPIEPLPDGRDLVGRWGEILDRRRTDEAHRITLQALMKAHPQPLDARNISGLAGIEEAESHGIVGTLVALGLTTNEKGLLRLSDECGMGDAG